MPELKPTQHNLKKIELLFKNIGYKVRYEKGNFESGVCILKKEKIIIVNKFLHLAEKIDVLINTLLLEDIDPSILSPENKKMFDDVYKKSVG